MPAGDPGEAIWSSLRVTDSIKGSLRMLIIVVTVVAVGLAALGLYLRKRLELLRQERMDENEYNTAVTVWEFARTIKSSVEDTPKGDTAVVDFRKIAVPHGTGFTLSLELHY